MSSRLFEELDTSLAADISPPYRCSCNLVLATREDLKDHRDNWKSTHGHGKQCPNPACGRPFSRVFNTKRHFISKHISPLSPGHMCYLCFSVYKQEKDLETHLGRTECRFNRRKVARIFDRSVDFTSNRVQEEIPSTTRSELHADLEATVSITPSSGHSEVDHNGSSISKTTPMQQIAHGTHSLAIVVTCCLESDGNRRCGHDKIVYENARDFELTGKSYSGPGVAILHRWSVYNGATTTHVELRPSLSAWQEGLHQCLESLVKGLLTLFSNNRRSPCEERSPSEERAKQELCSIIAETLKGYRRAQTLLHQSGMIEGRSIIEM